MNVAIFLFVGAALLFFALQAQAGQGGGLVSNGYQLQWDKRAPADLLFSLSSAAAGAAIRPEWLAAVVYIESRGDPSAVNSADPSYGIAQMQLPTARFYAGRVVTSQELLSDYYLALALAARFLADLDRKYRSGFSFAVWAQVYNLGETKFNKGLRNPDYGATVNDASGRSVFLNPGQLAAEFARFF